MTSSNYIVRFSILLLLVCIGILTNAQYREIVIKVTDTVSQSPLEYATIKIWSFDSSNKVVQGFSNNKGVFKFQLDKKIKDISIEVSRIGYLSKVVNNANTSEFILIKLKPSVEILSGVIVKGKEITRDVDKLTFKVNPDKYETGAPAIRVLRDVPLLSVSGNTISIKNQNNVPVYINGKISGSAMLNTLTVDMLDRVEVITNPSVRMSASGPTAFVNIVLKRPKKNQEMGNIGIVAAMKKRLVFPGISYQVASKKIYFYTNTSLQYSKQPFTFKSSRSENNTAKRIYDDNGNGNTEIKSGSVNATLFYDIDSSNEVSVDLSYYDDSFNGSMNSLNQYSLIDKTSEQDNLMKNKKKTIYAELEYKKKLSKISGLILSYQHSDIKSNSNKELSEDMQSSSLQSISIFSDSASTFGNAAQTMFYTSIFKKKIYLEAGINYKVFNSDNGFLNLFSQNGSMIEVPDNSGFIAINSKQFTGFTSTKFKFLDLAFRLGLRYESYNQRIVERTNLLKSINHFNDLFPNIVVQKKFNNSFNIIFNYQRRIRRPDISVLSPFLFRYSSATVYEGNPDISPEYLNMYELEASFQTDKSFFEISPYLHFTRNPIVYLGIANDSLLLKRYDNINHLEVKGISFSAKNDLSKNLQLNTNTFIDWYGYSRENNISGNYSGINIGFSFNVSYDIKKLFSVYSSVSYRKRSYDYQSYTEKNPKTDFSISKNLFGYKLYISAGISDIFNSGGRTKRFYNDNKISDIRFSNSLSRMFTLNVNYSFGKYFFNTKNQKGISKDGMKSMQIQ